MKKKTVLITGSSRGIGRATAVYFAEQGYHVFINCRTSVKELEETRRIITSLPFGSCSFLLGDVSKSKEVREMFYHIYEECSCLDVLINNAGISHLGLFTDTSDTKWSQMIHTNLSSAFYCCKAAVPAMIREKKGCILNVSSMWGTSGASCEVAYSAAKSGLNGLTKALAKELAPCGIPVNAVACGVIHTTMNAQLSEEDRLTLSDAIPAGRFGTPEEVAAFLYHLATSPSYVTGQIIGMDGGYL